MILVFLAGCDDQMYNQAAKIEILLSLQVYIQAALLTINVGASKITRRQTATTHPSMRCINMFNDSIIVTSKLFGYV